MRKRSEDACIASARACVARIKRAQEITNQCRMQIVKDCKDYVAAVMRRDSRAKEYPQQEAFAKKIGISMSTLRDYLGICEVITKVGNPDIHPRKAKKVFRRAAGRTKEEFKALVKIEDSKDKIRLKVESALEHIHTAKNFLEGATFRTADQDVWAMCASIATKVADFANRTIVIGEKN